MDKNFKAVNAPILDFEPGSKSMIGALTALKFLSIIFPFVFSA